MIARIRKWRIRQVAKKVSLALKEHHGEKKFYSVSELEEAIRSIGLSRAQREYAYAMFTDEEVCNGFLSRIGSSKSAVQMRAFLGGSMFGGGGYVSYDTSWNRFHDYDNEVLGGMQSFGSSYSAGSSGGCDGDGGSDYGDSGGGDDGGSD